MARFRRWRSTLSRWLLVLGGGIALAGAESIPEPAVSPAASEPQRIFVRNLSVEDIQALRALGLQPIPLVNTPKLLAAAKAEKGLSALLTTMQSRESTLSLGRIQLGESSIGKDQTPVLLMSVARTSVGSLLSPEKAKQLADQSHGWFEVQNGSHAISVLVVEIGHAPTR